MTANSCEWYKGNLHTHSHWSDGDVWPELAVLWYRENGYDFLALTDHDRLPRGERWREVATTEGGSVAYEKLKQRLPDWIEERRHDGKLEVRLRTIDELVDKLTEPGTFLLLEGEEIGDLVIGQEGSGSWSQFLHVHVNVINNRELIEAMGGGTVYGTLQNNVNAILAQQVRIGQPMLSVINHPNLYNYALNAEDLMRITGSNLFEVYNGHPGSNNAGDDNHPSMDRLWDIMLAWRLAELGLPIMYGIATDDAHDYHGVWNKGGEPGRGWVRVGSEELTAPALIAALQAGRFYASTGVELAHINSSPEGIDVWVDSRPGESYTIEFIGTRGGFDRSRTARTTPDGFLRPATRGYSDEVGAVLACTRGPKASYRFRGDELYVRARITASAPHPNPSAPGEFLRAWVQPVPGPAVT